MSMRWHLLNGQGGFPNSASKTTPQPANPRRTLLCHPDHHFKREERRQAIGLVRAPLKRMGVRLGTAHLSRIVSNNFVQRGRRPPCICPARGCFRVGVPMLRHLFDGQGGFPDSASKTTPQPANPRRTLLCHPDHHFKREERRQAIGLVRVPLKRMGVGL